MSVSPSSTFIPIPKLRKALKGRLIAPDDAAYDEARTVFVGDVDRRPTVIARVMGTYGVPVERAESVRVATIIVDGRASFPFMRETADRLAQLIPYAQRATLDGQSNDVDPAALAPVLAAFFAA